MVQPKWRCNFPGAPERPFRIEDLLELAVPGYLTFAQYERNLQTLTANAAAGGTDRKAGPPREGNALLQGLVVCGNCGRRMTVRYHTRPGGQIAPHYLCQNDGIQSAGKICQHMLGDCSAPLRATT